MSGVNIPIDDLVARAGTATVYGLRRPSPDVFGTLLGIIRIQAGRFFCPLQQAIIMFPLQEHMPHRRQFAVIDPGTDLIQQGRRFIEV